MNIKITCTSESANLLLSTTAAEKLKWSVMCIMNADSQVQHECYENSL